jgi:ABC-2 type transport system permease protein
VLPLLNLIYVAFFTALSLLPFFLTRGRLRSLRDNFLIFHKYTYLLVNLVKKDITTKYRRSFLGLLWSVLNPLLMMLVITAVFKNIFRIQIENFPVYYLTGSLIFNFMSEATSASMTSMLGAAGLIKKVYIPKYIFPLEKCLFALINGLFSFIAVLIIMPVLGVSFSWTIFLFWIPLLYVLLFSAGVGMMLAALTVFFRDVSHLYAVWVMAWMYMTPIIYPKDILPQSVMVIMQLNPMYYYVDYFRQVVMYGTAPSLATNLNCLIFSVVFLGLGLVIFKKTQDRFILYI